MLDGQCHDEPVDAGVNIVAHHALEVSQHDGERPALVIVARVEPPQPIQVKGAVRNLVVVEKRGQLFDHAALSGAIHTGQQQGPGRSIHVPDGTASKPPHLLFRVWLTAPTGSEEQTVSTVVVVTTNTLSEADAAELVGTAGGATFYVAVPEQPTSASVDAVMNDWELGVAAGRGTGSHAIADNEANPGAIARHDAQGVLAASLKALADAGADATGEVTPNHPLESIGDIVAHHNPDEVVVMVHHRHLNKLTHTDLAGKISRKFDVETLRVKAH